MILLSGYFSLITEEGAAREKIRVNKKQSKYNTVEKKQWQDSDSLNKMHRC